MKKYFLHNGSTQEGPFDLDELRSKNISKDAKVWYEGAADWKDAATISELKELFPPTPPPFHSVRPPLQRSNESNTFFGKKLLILLGCVVLALCAFYIYGQMQENKATANRQMQQEIDSANRKLTQAIDESKKKLVRDNIYDYVKVSNSAYTYRLIGGVSGLSMMLNNNSGYMLEDVKVKLSYIKADGGLLKDVDVDFTYVEAGHMQTIRIPDSDRGIGVRYQISSIRSIALGLQ